VRCDGGRRRVSASGKRAEVIRRARR
jgi:hypothetical protein